MRKGLEWLSVNMDVTAESLPVLEMKATPL
jgi:hypothetical protein